MPHKNDLIMWLRMQPQQRRIYEVLPACLPGLCSRLQLTRLRP